MANLDSPHGPWSLVLGPWSGVPCPHLREKRCAVTFIHSLCFDGNKQCRRGRRLGLFSFKELLPTQSLEAPPVWGLGMGILQAAARTLLALSSLPLSQDLHVAGCHLLGRWPTGSPCPWAVPRWLSRVLAAPELEPSVPERPNATEKGRRGPQSPSRLWGESLGQGGAGSQPYLPLQREGFQSPF